LPQILHHSRKRILERRGPAGARPYPGGGGETSPCRVSLRAASPPDTAPRAPPLRLYGQTAQPTPTPPQHSTAQQPTRGTATDPGHSNRPGRCRSGRGEAGSEAARGPSTCSRCQRPSGSLSQTTESTPAAPTSSCAAAARASERAHAAARARGAGAYLPVLTDPSDAEHVAALVDIPRLERYPLGLLRDVRAAQHSVRPRGGARCGQGAVLWRALAGRAAAS